MNTITEVYEEVETSALVSRKCSCGSMINRTLKTLQTLNPWNKNQHGILKSRGEIIQENNLELKEMEKDFMESSELCAACLKKGIPDIVLNPATVDDWEASKDLRDEVFHLKETLARKEKSLDSMFKGKSIKVTLKGKERDAVIQHVSWWAGNTMEFAYEIVRFDMKGLMDTRFEPREAKHFFHQGDD